MNKRAISLLIVIVMIFSLIPSALADGYVRIVNKNDQRIETMLNAIDEQNFNESGADAAKAKQMISHVVFNCRFAAINGGCFDYPNSCGYVTVIDDGTYKVNIRGAKGCFAYANYVANLVYGEEVGTAGLSREVGRQIQTAGSLKNLLVTNAQAGEHIRIGDVHSVVFVSADSNGFYCLSYQSADAVNNIELQYWTYEDFVNYRSYSGNEMYLFNANTNVNAGGDIQTESPFTDVPVGSVYYDAVVWIYGKGITKGVTETEYNTSAPCTREQAVTFLWRAAGCPKPKTAANNQFSDVSPYSCFYDALIWASEEGICKGYGDGTFRPTNIVTRAQFITFLWRIAGSPQMLTVNNPFKDVYSGNYYNAILWGNSNDIIKGYSDGTFRPDDPCTRGHVAMFLYRDLA